jgi:hypothetical protein
MQITYAHSLLTYHLDYTQLLALGCPLELIEKLIEGSFTSLICQKMR